MRVEVFAVGLVSGFVEGAVEVLVGSEGAAFAFESVHKIYISFNNFIL